MSLPFLKFPCLVRREILSHFDYCDIFRLSVCSARTRKSIENITRTPKKVRYICRDNELEIGIYHKLYCENFYSVISIHRVEPILFYGEEMKINIGGKSIQCGEWDDSFICHHYKFSYSLKYINPRQGKVLQALQAHINSLWPNLPLIQFEICFYRGFCPSLIDSKVKDIIFDFDDMNTYMLESILTSHSNIESVCISKELHGKLRARSKLMRVPSVRCNVGNQSSLTENLLENFKGNRLILDMASNCEQTVSHLIKDWMFDAKYPNLKALIVHLAYSARSFGDITKDLNGVKWDEYRMPTEEELDRSSIIFEPRHWNSCDWHMSYDIKQKDTGKMATVNCQYKAVIFFVWDCQNQ
ncbi:hypothetical protein CRE_20472 [Caenorhabditis remanei]|uniref:Uncharacterized protein n=1 Tax=Caenorhabditis remanei TaxID=31234 RepID=E3N2R8_CAERE|nr:hypothetical protein CRE_20472 [Caenorhabditis remanei]